MHEIAHLGALMSHGPTTLTGGRGSRAIGVVSGSVLTLARRSTGLTQERFAESLAVDVTTVQGWESGRRPLGATNVGDFLRLTSRLTRLGAPTSTRRHLTQAIEADQVLSAGIAGGPTFDPESGHPLAAGVYRRNTTNLITWPITRIVPHHLRGYASKVPRRGPVATHPSLSDDQRTRFFDHLQVIAERCAHPDGALLRRQAVYLLGFDGRPHVVDWLRDEWRRAGHKPVRDGDIVALLGARSASVALASAGECRQIHDFVERMTEPGAHLANLTYWAHWIGELGGEQTSDEFMVDRRSRPWTGSRLLHHLIDRLVPDDAHLPLNLATLHALVASRPNLLAEQRTVHRRLNDVFDQLVSSGDLSRTGRDQVVGLRYALNIADS